MGWHREPIVNRVIAGRNAGFVLEAEPRINLVAGDAVKSRKERDI